MRERERERERVITLFVWENMFRMRELEIYSKRIGIRKLKIKGRWMDKGRVILRLRVVEKWKGKREW